MSKSVSMEILRDLFEQIEGKAKDLYSDVVQDSIATDADPDIRMKKYALKLGPQEIVEIAKDGEPLLAFHLPATMACMVVTLIESIKEEVYNPEDIRLLKIRLLRLVVEAVFNGEYLKVDDLSDEVPVKNIIETMQSSERSKETIH